MDTIWWVVIVVAVALVILAVAARSYSQSRRRTALRDQFGPEYDRTVGEAGSRRKAERELAERERVHESLEIQPLSEDARARFTRGLAARRAAASWTTRSSRHARPTGSCGTCSTSAATRRGDFDKQADAVSVDHPEAVQRYRHGHEMVHGNGANGDDRTENLRKAMVDFREVFAQLVEAVPTPRPSRSARSAGPGTITRGARREPRRAPL